MNYTLLGLVIACVVLGGYLLYDSSSVPTVSAVGEVTLSAVPDEVVIYLDVTARAGTAQEAQEKMRALSESTAVALRAAGVDDSSLQQQQEQVYPDYSWETGRQILRGYIASQSIQVRTPDVREVASLIDAAVGAGALVQGINFELSDAHASDLKAEALTAAGKDAQKKATALAEGVGKSLGSVVAVQNDDYSHGPIVYYARAEGGSASDAKVAAASLTPRDVDVSARVTVTYRLSRW
jgi:uncharacterized protein YggE